MQKRFIPYLCLTISSFLLITYMAGCASSDGVVEKVTKKVTKIVGLESSGHKRIMKTSSTLSDSKDELLKTKSIIGDAMTTMNGLVQQTFEDILKQYKQFSKELANAEKQCSKMCDSAEEIQAQGDRFYIAWEEELASFDNPDIRKRSEDRRQISLESYHRMTIAVQAAVEGFDPFLAEMKDIQKYLDIDLTPAGIASISTQIEKTIEKATVVQENIDVAVAEIDRVKAEMPFIQSKGGHEHQSPHLSYRMAKAGQCLKKEKDLTLFLLNRLQKHS